MLLLMDHKKNLKKQAIFSITNSAILLKFERPMSLKANFKNQECILAKNSKYDAIIS